MITNATAQSAAPVIADIRDIKPPVEIPNGWAWLWWTVAVLAVSGAAVLLWRLLKNRKVNIVPPPPVPAHVRAKQKLAEALALISQPKPFVVAVSDTARTYLEERFDFHAPERTTEEFLRELGATKLLLPEQKESLGDFLASCDLVKFAKYEPGENELLALHGSALRLVEETEPEEIKPQETEGQQIHQTESISPQIQKQQPANGKKSAITGVILQLGNTVFFFPYVVGLMRELKFYQDLSSKVSQEMSHEMSMDFDKFLSAFSQPPKWLGEQQSIWDSVLIASGIGAIVGFVGLVLILVALTKQNYRAEWLFWFLVIYSVILCGAFPFGTVFGIFFLVYCLTKRREFLNET